VSQQPSNKITKYQKLGTCLPDVSMKIDYRISYNVSRVSSSVGLPKKKEEKGILPPNHDE
jgi:hypothetical protein